MAIPGTAHHNHRLRRKDSSKIGSSQMTPPAQTTFRAPVSVGYARRYVGGLCVDVAPHLERAVRVELGPEARPLDIHALPAANVERHDREVGVRWANGHVDWPMIMA